ncbi:MAG: hypothetical protein ICV64_03010 [Thermoleophilia bacterium]|nr:hypothetical protein [Thermoleophilia bacterium]
MPQLVTELPPANKPETWKRWLYERTRPRRGAGARSRSAECSSSSASPRWRGFAPGQRHARREGNGTRIDRQALERQLRDRVLRRRGKQKWETIGPSRHEAERALTARKCDVDTGTWREPSSETLAAYAERWLAHRDPARGGGRTRLSPSTFEGYRLNLRRHVLPRLGDRALSSLRTEDVDRLIAELEAGGSAPGTVRNVIVPLGKMLADAVRQGLLLANPAARTDLPPAQTSPARRSRLSTPRRSAER